MRILYILIIFVNLIVLNLLVTIMLLLIIFGVNLQVLKHLKLNSIYSKFLFLITFYFKVKINTKIINISYCSLHINYIYRKIYMINPRYSKDL